MGDGGIYLYILKLGARWRWTASSPRRFTPAEIAPRTHWRLDGCQSRSGGLGEETSAWNSLVNALQCFGPVRSVVTLTTELPWLSMTALHLKRAGCDITNIPKGAEAAALNSENRQREAKYHPSRQEISQGSSQCSQQPPTDSYPQPHVSIPHLPIVFCKISFDITLPSALSSSKQSLPGASTKTLHALIVSSLRATYPTHPHSHLE